VIASDRSSLPEVTGDAGLQVDPLNVAELSAGLERLLFDSSLRETLIAKGEHQSGRFKWGAAARNLLTIYQQLLS